MLTEMEVNDRDNVQTHDICSNIILNYHLSKKVKLSKQIII
jgi:hypothetical protein